ncbi:hypothetical protein LUZ60_007590 [Juncus effusus]|nr:hypothetical protein LUZ60_007590 [Juncus effusus]
MEEFESCYEISRTVDFIQTRNYTKIVLQFPDELLKDSARVSKALKRELGKGVRLYVMADTAYNSCCVDEVGASYVAAECVVHYGHACMSPTSNLPALFVFGKSPLNTSNCAESIFQQISSTQKAILVLYGLEYAHAMENLKETLKSINSDLKINFAQVNHSFIEPSQNDPSKEEDNDTETFENNLCEKEGPDCKFCLGGLSWKIPINNKMEDYLIFWIGRDNSAFSNVVLTFNNCEIVRFDADKNEIANDISHLQRILKRRYYLVEKAKDANIVGILVGTLGVAGYLHIIDQMKELIEKAGKKSYTLVMGRPTSHKLANFPEIEVFVYVSCAQTALLDSKDFLSPVITPFEATLAFAKGREWTGVYLLDFQDLISSPQNNNIINGNLEKEEEKEEEARFSFIKGGYVESNSNNNNTPQEENRDDNSLALAKSTEKALTLKNQDSNMIMYNGFAKSGSDYFSARSFRGLNPEFEIPVSESYIVGRTGRAAGYKDEKNEES